MVAGHDTNASALAWVCYLLGRHPEAQRRVQAEVDAVFGDDNDHVITMDELRDLTYLECVVKEALR